MNLDRLIQKVSSMHPLSDKFKKALGKHLTHLSLPKNHLLLEAPKISEHAYFLEKGYAMCYTFIDGNKKVRHFWKEGDFIFSGKSFFQRIPSNEFIQLLEPAEVLCVSYDSVMELFMNYEEANFLYRSIIMQYYDLAVERLDDLQHLNARERYKKLRRTLPNIEQLVPSEYIASYLGMVPHTLSRVKRKNGGI